MKELGTSRDPHPLAPDDPGIPGQEEYGLGSKHVNAMFALALKKAGHIKRLPDQVSADARAHLQRMVNERENAKRERARR
jgi:hypothetical protein